MSADDQRGAETERMRTALMGQAKDPGHVVAAGRLLDLYSAAGGASRGYQIAGWHVTGVDHNPQPRYAGDEFVQADALEYLAANWHRFDAVHASPHCQRFCAYRRKGHGVGDGYPDQLPDTRAALCETGLPYVIENVPGAPLLDPVQLCGSSFGLDVRRHRLFETNWPLTVPPCDHAWQTPRFAPASNRTNLRSTVEVGVYRIPLAVQQAAMGIDWMRLNELSLALPPAYTEHIGRALHAHTMTQEAA